MINVPNILNKEGNPSKSNLGIRVSIPFFLFFLTMI
jgi:hypothetical protein